MMDKEKLISNWDDLKNETKTKILALASKEIEKNYFIPKEGDEYYHYTIAVQNCEIKAYSGIHSNTIIDKNFIEMGNCFKTYQEAIFAGSCDYYTKRFKTCVNRCTDKLNWHNEDQDKYYVYYNYFNESLWFAKSVVRKEQGIIYASEEQILKNAINEIGEDNFLQYVIQI